MILCFDLLFPAGQQVGRRIVSIEEYPHSDVLAHSSAELVDLPRRRHRLDDLLARITGVVPVAGIWTPLNNWQAQAKIVYPVDANLWIPVPRMATNHEAARDVSGTSGERLFPLRCDILMASGIEALDFFVNELCCLTEQNLLGAYLGDLAKHCVP